MKIWNHQLIFITKSVIYLNKSENIKFYMWCTFLSLSGFENYQKSINIGIIIPKAGRQISPAGQKK